ncbi:hypothetical protein AHF37_01218 [Paragonimus kellicotti]|nr:hypothetical protein AHF37_01218 [Paragonimus kellicotti]
MVLRSGPQAAYYDGLVESHTTWKCNLPYGSAMQISCVLLFNQVTVPSSQVIPLDILLDTFELPQDVSAAAPNPEAHPPSICTPRRWTDRSRRQAAHIQVNSGQ